MKFKKFQVPSSKFQENGFTLIELLVVISIIGVLASVVLVSLDSTKNKAKDAIIQNSISQVRAVAELSKDDNGDFDSVCDDPNITGIIATNVSDNEGTLVCNDNADEYCVSSNLNNGGHVCVDDLTTLKFNAAGCGAGTVCP